MLFLRLLQDFVLRNDIRVILFERETFSNLFLDFFLKYSYYRNLVQELEYPREKRDRKTSTRLESDDADKGK